MFELGVVSGPVVCSRMDFSMLGSHFHLIWLVLLHPRMVLLAANF